MGGRTAAEQRYIDFLSGRHKSHYTAGIEGASIETIIESDYFKENLANLYASRMISRRIPADQITEFPQYSGLFQPHAVALNTSVVIVVQAVDQQIASNNQQVLE